MFSDLIEEMQPFARLLFDAASRAGLQPRVTSTRRSRAQQKRLYDRFLAGMSPYPALPPGLSSHEFGYAFDMTSLDLRDVGLTWQSWGGIWGGKRDPVHFEYPGFVPPSDDPDVQKTLTVCDALSGFIPVLGELQLAESIAEFISPLQSSPESLERSIQDFIQGPCTFLYGKNR